MPNPIDELRTVSDEILDDATTLKALTTENRATPAGTGRARDVAAAMERVARRVLRGARREHTLVAEVHAKAVTAGPDAPTATIEETKPDEGYRP
jgi:hypothetical protein